MVDLQSERDDLLRPTLSPDTGASPAIYSANALFITAFFGGPFALIAMAALNSQRLGRVRQDAAYLLLGALLTVAFVVIVYRPGAGWSVGDLSPAGTERLLWRAFSLVLAAGAYLVHRRSYRNMALIGIESPSPWKAGVACCLAGGLVLAGAVVLVRM
jgi:hypothetical protein